MAVGSHLAGRHHGNELLTSSRYLSHVSRQVHMTSVFGNAIWSTAFARSLTYTWVVDSTEGRWRRGQQRKSIAEKLALAGGPATGRHAWITSEFCPVVRPRRSITPAARNDRLPSMQPTGVHLNKRTASLSVHCRCRPHQQQQPCRQRFAETLEISTTDEPGTTINVIEAKTAIRGQDC